MATRKSPCPSQQATRRGSKGSGRGCLFAWPGLVNYARAMGRGLGLYGPEEVQRFYREMDASGLGMRFIAKNPELSAQIAREGAMSALKTQPMLLFHLGCTRLSFRGRHVGSVGALADCRVVISHCLDSSQPFLA